MSIARITSFAAAMATTLGLAACSGGSTYGTGTSQEVQLLKDVGGILTLGKGKEKKERINYTARPKLVQAPNDGYLPAPVETASVTDDGSFPVDDEVRRARLRENGYDPLAAASGAATGDGADDRTFLAPDDPNAPKIVRDRERTNSIAVNHTNIEDPGLSEKQRAAFLERQKRLSSATGTAPRKYLTDPPVEYRTPAETAEIGNPGEKEPRPRIKVDDSHRDSRDPFDN